MATVVEMHIYRIHEAERYTYVDMRTLIIDAICKVKLYYGTYQFRTKVNQCDAVMFQLAWTTKEGTL